jgi:hypothetical protein
MRMACCLALAALLTSAAPAHAQGERALVVVMPDARVGELADAGFHVAVASPAVDADAAGQTFLDISQGARVSTRVYDEDLPRFRLRPGGQISRWDFITKRADDAPADLVPGLLGQTILGVGGSTAYVGVRGRSHRAGGVRADNAQSADSGRGA